MKQTLEELQNKLESLNNTIDKLLTEKKSVRNEISKLLRNAQNFKVGDDVITSKHELGKIISINGAPDCPVIVLIHRTDVFRDDVGYFDDCGLFYGYNGKYTIKKK